jgi:perosamine synthetase
MSIPLLQPSCSADEARAVTEVLWSGWWGQGKKCIEFENGLADLYGYEHCVSVNSCTAALHLSVVSLDIGPGDEVIVPALTFISTALAVSYTGATPVFADVRPDTLTIDWNDVLRKVTPRTKAIIPVDYAGYPADWQGPHRIPIIQDAAHSCGGIGYGDLVCLSFHPVKNLATPDAGAILTNDEGVAKRLRALRWCGIDRSTWERTENRYGWDYDIEEIGYKYHLSDVSAAIGVVQLGRLKDMNLARARIAERYMASLFDLEGAGRVTLPARHPCHTWHLYSVRVDPERRDRIIDHMLAHDISVGVHYKPLNTYPMYKGVDLPVTDREWKRLITLPVFVDLSHTDQLYVIRTFREAVLA